MAEFLSQSTLKLLASEARVVIDMDEDIFLLEPAATPFFQILGKLPKKKATSYKVEWMEDSYGSIWDAVNNGAGYNSTATSIVVDDGTKFIADDLVLVYRTGEVIFVRSVSTNTLTVVRGYEDTPPTNNAALLDNDKLIIMGQAKEEGWTPAAMKRKALGMHYNYVQFFSKFIHCKECTENVRLYGGSERRRLLNKKGVEIKRDIENGLMMGRRALDTTSAAATSDHLRGTMGGLEYFVTSNVMTPANGELSESYFDDTVMETMFEYGSMEKWLFSGSKILAFLTAVAKKRWAPPQVDGAYGVRVETYYINGCTVHCVRHPLLISSYAGHGFFIDVENVIMRDMENMKLNANVQSKKSHTVEDEYFSELSVEIKGEKTHGIIKGVTGYTV